MAHELDTIILDLESGDTISKEDLDFLVDINKGNPIMEFLFGSGSGVVDLLSTTGKDALQESVIAQGETGLSISKDLGLVIAEPFFTGGGTAKILKAGGGEVISGVVGKEIASKAVKEVATETAKMSKKKKALIFSAIATPLGLWGNWDRIESVLGIGGDGSTPINEPPDANLSLPENNEPIFFDPVTGEQIFISQVDPTAAASDGVQNAAAGASAFGPAIQQYANDLGVSVAQTGLLFGGLEAFNNPLFLGEKKIDESEFPAGVDVKGVGIAGAKEFLDKRLSSSNPSLSGLLPPEDAAARAAYGIAAPPGAQLNPAFFSPIAPSTGTTPQLEGGDLLLDSGRQPFAPASGKQFGEPVPLPSGPVNLAGVNEESLSTIAAAAAREFGVPIDVLYGVINATSGWNPSAVGNGGNTYGLGQIDQQFITKSAAQDPTISLRYVARNLASNFDKFGAWEIAALDYNEKGAGDTLVEDGTISKSNKSWLTNALESSARSGLGSNVFDFAGLAALSDRRAGGTGRQGPTIPEFIEPDKALLRENARNAVQAIYGRDTSGNELSGFVDLLMKGYREAYDQQVVAIKGGKSTDVNPQAQLLDTLRTSGEGQFRVERDQQRSMMDSVSDWVRILKEA